MNGATIEGLNDVIDAIRRIPTVLDREGVFDQVSQTFASRLRAATPPGITGNLKKSVLFEATEEEGIVGYSEGVEQDGNPALDSVTRPRTIGRSVLRWVPTEELETILSETFDAFASEGVLFMEESFAAQINGGT